MGSTDDRTRVVAVMTSLQTHTHTRRLVVHVEYENRNRDYVSADGTENV